MTIGPAPMMSTFAMSLRRGIYFSLSAPWNYGARLSYAVAEGAWLQPRRNRFLGSAALATEGPRLSGFPGTPSNSGIQQRTRSVLDPLDCGKCNRYESDNPQHRECDDQRILSAKSPSMTAIPSSLEKRNHP